MRRGPGFLLLKGGKAEREGFEPSRRLNTAYAISNRGNARGRPVHPVRRVHRILLYKRKTATPSSPTRHRRPFGSPRLLVGCRSVAGSSVAPPDEPLWQRRPTMHAEDTRRRAPCLTPPVRKGRGFPPTRWGVRRISSSGGGTRRSMFVVHPDGQLEPCGEAVPLPRHYRFGVGVALDSDAHPELLETIVWVRRKPGASLRCRRAQSPRYPLRCLRLHLRLPLLSAPQRVAWDSWVLL